MTFSSFQDLFVPFTAQKSDCSCRTVFIGRGRRSPSVWTLPQLSVTVRHQDQRSRRAALAQNRAGTHYTLKWPQFLLWTRSQGPAQLQLSSGFRTSHRRWIQTHVLPRFPPTAGSSLQNKSAEGQWVLQQGPVGEDDPVLM